MDVQTTRSGKAKLDANAEPLRSVQIIQSPEQKHEMLNIMHNVARIYTEQPDLFPEGEFQIGNDPKSYTVEEMMIDFLERHDKWKMFSNAHLYRSFIDRHNWMVAAMSDSLNEHDMADDAKYVYETYTIKLRLPKHEQITRSLQKSEIFDIPNFRP